MIYHAIQDPADDLSATDLAALDAQVSALQDAVTSAKGQERLLRTELASLNATISTDELRSHVRLLQSKKQELTSRLQRLDQGVVKPVSLEEKDTVDKTWAYWAKKARLRKKICLDMWAMLSEEVPEGMTKEDLWVRPILSFVFPAPASLFMIVPLCSDTTTAFVVRKIGAWRETMSPLRPVRCRSSSQYTEKYPLMTSSAQTFAVRNNAI